MKPDLDFVWPADRITDDHSVEDRIHNAVLAERRITRDVLDFQADINQAVSMQIETVEGVPSKNYSAADMLKYAEQVRADEQERCAKIADQWAIASHDAEQIAAAIRSGQ